MNHSFYLPQYGVRTQGIVKLVVECGTLASTEVAYYYCEQGAGDIDPTSVVDSEPKGLLETQRHSRY